jgi:hypothetical protein
MNDAEILRRPEAIAGCRQLDESHVDCFAHLR